MRSIQAGFELVAINHALENPVLARQIGKAADPVGAAHVNGEAGMPRLAGCHTLFPERRCVGVDRVGGGEI